MKNHVNADKIIKYCQKNNISKNDFCKACGISAATYYKVISGENISISTLRKIADYMNTNILTLFSD